MARSQPSQFHVSYLQKLSIYQHAVTLLSGVCTLTGSIIEWDSWCHRFVLSYLVGTVWRPVLDLALVYVMIMSVPFFLENEDLRDELQ